MKTVVRSQPVFGPGYFLEIFQHLGMSGTAKVVVPYAIGLVFLVIALISIKTPIEPIQIKFLHITNQIYPINITLIITKLTQNKRSLMTLHPPNK